MSPNEDTKYQDVINTLRQLQQVKAPSGFEADLNRRINSEEYIAEKRYWRDIFIPSRLIPSAALAVTAILLIFVLDHSGVNQNNPLNTAPRERQNVTLSSKSDNIRSEEKSIKGSEVTALQERKGIQSDKDEGVHNKSLEKPLLKGTESKPAAGRQKTPGYSVNDRFITADFASGRITDYPVKKAGLNFRQVNLSNEQKMEVNLLKEKLETTFKTKGKQ